MNHSSHSSNASSTKRHSYDYNKPTNYKRQRYADSNMEGHGSLVADHYNSRRNTSKFERKNSKIYYMRNFNNWIKSTIIRKYIDVVKRNLGSDNITALDLGAGKGGDLLKWEKGRIGKLICTDLAETSVEQCEERYKKLKKRSHGRVFDAEFIACDSTKETLKNKFNNPDLTFHLTSCQFVMHYAFESESQAETMVKNACYSLKDGGYLIGSTVNDAALIKNLQKSPGLHFGNDIYNVSFESKDSFPDYGCKYMFKLHDVVDCPEFVLKKNLFVKLCKKYGMRLVEWKPFSTFFYENVNDSENFRLIKKMEALEVYPPRAYSHLNSEVVDDYNHAKKECNRLHAKYPNSTPLVATLSKTEWEAASIYVVYVFIKDKDCLSSKDCDGQGSNSDDPHHTTEFEKIPLIIL